MHYAIRADVRNASRDNRKREQKQQKCLEYYDWNSIFLRLTAELARKYPLIVIFVCLHVGMWGILAGEYILAVKEWVIHLCLAFRRSCFS